MTKYNINSLEREYLLNYIKELEEEIKTLKHGSNCICNSELRYLYCAPCDKLFY